MTPERTKQVLMDGSQWSNYDKHMTEAEIAYVMDLWRKMPGYTCFYDAICRIANREENGVDQNLLAKDIAFLETYKDRKTLSITEEGILYDVYGRYGFLDPKRHTIKDAIFLMRSRLTDPVKVKAHLCEHGNPLMDCKECDSWTRDHQKFIATRGKHRRA